MRLDDWHSYHLFYHGGRNRLLTLLVRPMVTSLLASDLIESFFFIRYDLAGPHIRLRLCCKPGCWEEVEEAVTSRASDFFAHHPSTESRDPITLQRINRTILATSPEERDEAVYPDNSLKAFPFEPEIERYGGEALLGHSLDFFALSSFAALDFVAGNDGAPLARQLPQQFRWLARQAWGYAGNREEFLELLDSWAPNPAAVAPLIAEADRTFEKSRDTLCALLHDEIEGLAGSTESPAPPGSPQAYARASRHLSSKARDAGREAWLRVGVSQLHMTANRMGLGNPEEIYLGRLLFTSARRLGA